ncbi:MAG: hypothetical protein LBH54_02495, partial [Clostridiales bacterium]|nr:hypothetical protein [Clostridiales bacterium]
MLFKKIMVFCLSLFVSAGMVGMPAAAAPAANAVFTPGDANIGYAGRWDRSDASRYVSHWARAYFKARFTGTTVKLKLGGPVNLGVSIDGAPETIYEYNDWYDVPKEDGGGTGVYDLTPAAPLAPGEHTLIVSTLDGYDKMYFKGLVLDGDAALLPAVMSEDSIEFIGDSITNEYRSYAWKVSRELGAENTTDAFAGVPLCNESWGYGVDMGDLYFKLDRDGTTDWTFPPAREPDVIVINLGTNDRDTAAETVLADYITFLRNVRLRNP